MPNSTKPSSTPSTTLTYQDAGVNIDAGNALVDNIKPLAKSTYRPGVLGSLGGFGGCFEIPKGYTEPVLVSGTDGVGTKLRLAIDLARYDGIGIDLVAMCANDLVVMGAEPLFFLDYYATGQLDVTTATQVVASIAKGCIESGCALIGGETAEMPGMYHDNDFDLAGFCVGVVEKSRIVDGSKVKAGDVIIALASSGPHSNGYSLVRKVLEVSQADLSQPLSTSTDSKSLADHLLAPTKLYVKSVLALHQANMLNAAAHITGGGFWENIPRVLPDNLCAKIHNQWQWPAIFDWLQQKGHISTHEMYRTFNCGVGMICVVDAEHATAALALLKSHQEDAFIIGQIQTKTDLDSASVIIEGVN